MMSLSVGGVAAEHKANRPSCYTFYSSVESRVVAAGAQRMFFFRVVIQLVSFEAVSSICVSFEAVSNGFYRSEKGQRNRN